MENGKRKHVHIGTCQCGCGAMFFANYTTRKPAYTNRLHRDRAERGRARARALATDFCRSQKIDPNAYRADLDMTEWEFAYDWYWRREQDRNWQLHCKDTPNHRDVISIY
jgi:hypothetical protein